MRVAPNRASRSRSRVVSAAHIAADGEGRLGRRLPEFLRVVFEGREGREGRELCLLVRFYSERIACCLLENAQGRDDGNRGSCREECGAPEQEG